MKCPFCGNMETKVTDSRVSGEMDAIKRRRECLGCQERFTTFETWDLTLQVHKRDGRYEEFQQGKLIHGLQSACSHTRVSHTQVRAVADQLITDLLKMQTKEISTQDIGELVMERLKNLDMIAYIRFACVYRRFKDLDELMEEIHSIGVKEDQTLK